MNSTLCYTLNTRYQYGLFTNVIPVLDYCSPLVWRMGAWGVVHALGLHHTNDGLSLCALLLCELPLLSLPPPATIGCLFLDCVVCTGVLCTFRMDPLLSPCLVSPLPSTVERAMDDVAVGSFSLSTPTLTTRLWLLLACCRLPAVADSAVRRAAISAERHTTSSTRTPRHVSGVQFDGSSHALCGVCMADRGVER